MGLAFAVFSCCTSGVHARAGQVDAIVSLIREVTGARMYAFYKAPEQAQRGFFTMWQYSGKPGHTLRRLYIRWGAC